MIDSEQIKNHIGQLWAASGQLAVEIEQLEERLEELRQRKLAGLGSIDFAIQLLKEQEEQEKQHDSSNQH